MPPRRSKVKEAEHILAAANTLDESAFAQYLPPERTIISKSGDARYTWTFHTSARLSEADCNACFHLIEETSSADYKKASQGWRPDQKLVEMREKDMRYLLLWGTGSDTGGRLLAFTSFMLTMEDDEPVVYIYEIHLTAELRGSGIGKAVMQIVEGVGRKVGASMSMLTVFTANTHAEAVYRRLGYSEDASSPRTRKLRGGKVKRPEYLIMSKSLQAQANGTTKRVKRL